MAVLFKLMQQVDRKLQKNEESSLPERGSNERPEKPQDDCQWEAGTRPLLISDEPWHEALGCNSR
jgi:hypothetical protein